MASLGKERRPTERNKDKSFPLTRGKEKKPHTFYEHSGTLEPVTDNSVNL